jgi:hypothetical protein
MALAACTAELGQGDAPEPKTEIPSVWLKAWDQEGLKALCLQRLVYSDTPSSQKGQTRALLLYHRSQFHKSASELQRLRLACPVPIISFKGHGTTGQLYSDPSARTSRDIDLLVKPEHMLQFQAFLNKQGYQPDLQSPHVFRNDFQELDLHTQLFAGIPWPTKISQDQLWSSAVLVQGAGYRLCLAHEFLLALSHATTHGFGRMIWLLDLAILKKALGSQQSKLLAESHGMSKAYRWMDELHRTLFGLDAPKNQLGWLEKLLLSRVQNRQSGDRLGRLMLLMGIPNRLDQLKYLARLIWGQEQNWTRLQRLWKAIKS